MTDLGKTAPYTVFSALTEEEWIKIVYRSVQDRDVRGIRLPGLPPDDVQVQTIGSANEGALREAASFYRFVRKVCDNNDVVLGSKTSILDFGVGWGRIMRFFLKDTDPDCIHGVDTNAYLIDLARNTGCPGNLQVINPRGCVRYSDGHFDVIYAYSVFTHLPEEVQDLWLMEISRVLKAGGVFVATVEPPRFIDYFLDIDVSDTGLHPWHASMAHKIQADTTLKSRLSATGFVYIPGSDVYGDSVMTPDYIAQHWGRFFEVLEFLDDRSKFWQAVVTCRGKDN